MIPPGMALGYFAVALVLGAGLGLVYSFLRPVKRRWLADLIFVFCAGWAWLVLAFRVCRGDLRGAYLLGMTVGMWGTKSLFGPFFSGFWKIMAIPAKKISENAKKLFASGEKSVTMKCSNRRLRRQSSGGRTHGKHY